MLEAICAHKAGIAVGQVESEEMRLVLHATDHHPRFAKIGLGRTPALK